MSSPTIIRSRKLLRIRRWQRFIFWSMATAMFSAGSIIFTIRITPIRTIVVSGVQPETERAIRDALSSLLQTRRWGILPQQNLAFVDAGGFENALQNDIPQIRTVALERRFFEQTLVVRAQEREPWGVWCSQDSTCSFIDRNGERFGRARSASSSSGIIIEAQGNTSIQPKNIVLAVESIASLDAVSIDRVRLEQNSSAIEFDTHEGWMIYLDDANDIRHTAENLAALLRSLGSQRERLAYIDLRIPDKGFYKLR